VPAGEDDIADLLERLGAGDVDLGDEHDRRCGRCRRDHVLDTADVHGFGSVRARLLRRLNDDHDPDGVARGSADVVAIGDAADDHLGVKCGRLPGEYADGA
jgi:hypothetical protein